MRFFCVCFPRSDTNSHRSSSHRSSSHRSSASQGMPPQAQRQARWLPESGVHTPQYLRKLQCIEEMGCEASRQRFNSDTSPHALRQSRIREKQKKLDDAVAEAAAAEAAAEAAKEAAAAKLGFDGWDLNGIFSKSDLAQIAVRAEEEALAEERAVAARKKAMANGGYDGADAATHEKVDAVLARSRALHEQLARMSERSQTAESSPPED